MFFNTLVMADKEELFDLVDDADNVIGTELRSIVHQRGALDAACSSLISTPPLRATKCCRGAAPTVAGLLHRAVYAWVFRPDGALLIQRRSPHKKIGGGKLDLSVAEHLQPGESYLQVRCLPWEGLAAADAGPACLQCSVPPSCQLHLARLPTILPRLAVCLSILAAGRPARAIGGAWH